VRRFVPALIVSLGLVVGACASGPSPAALERDQIPAVTTTTEPPPEGVLIVIINNGALRPSNVQLDLRREWIVRWINEDPPREYVLIERNGAFESPLLGPGDVFEVDFSELEPGLYRYHTELGAQRIPGLVDTRARR
jgi:hypothetical protein